MSSARVSARPSGKAEGSKQKAAKSTAVPTEGSSSRDTFSGDPEEIEPIVSQAKASETGQVESADVEEPRDCRLETKAEAEKRLQAEYWRHVAIKTLTDGWNYWINTGVGIQIASTSLRLADKTLIKFRKIRWIGPRISPKDAILSGATYSCALRCTAVHVVDGVDKQSREFSVLSPPLMLGSRLCMTQQVADSEEALNALGICKYDPLGWFIVNGSLKKITMEKQMRHNRMYVYTGPRLVTVREGQLKTALQARITYAKPLGNTSVVYAEVTPDRKIMVYLPFMEKKMEKEKGGEGNMVKGSLMMPVFSIIRLHNLFQPGRVEGEINDTFLGRSDFLNQILRMSPKKWRAKMTQELQFSLVDVLGSNEYDEEGGIADDFNYYRTQIKNNNISDEALAEKFRFGFRDSFFSYIGPKFDFQKNEINNFVQERYDTFCLLIARLVEVMAGFREPDDRNSWSNNRVTRPDDHMARLFANAWGAKIEKIQALKASESNNFDDIVSALDDKKPFEITEDVNRCFRTGEWGIGTRNKKKNVTVPPKRGNIIAVYSDMLRINTISNERSRDPRLRDVQPSGLGINSANDTPESGRCGLVNSITIGLTTSMNREHEPIAIQLRLDISKYIVPPEDSDKPGVCILVYNGIMVGWVKAELEHKAREWRRAKRPYDMAVVREENVLFLHTDGSRPIRPLLIVDTKDNRLVIDKTRFGLKDKEGKVIDPKSGWEMPFDLLLSSGCVEMIDAWEQEYTTIAVRYSNILDWEKKIKELDNRRIVLEEEIRILEASVIDPKDKKMSLTEKEFESLRNMAEESQDIRAEEVSRKIALFTIIKSANVELDEASIKSMTPEERNAAISAIQAAQIEAGEHRKMEIGRRKSEIVEIDKQKYRLAHKQVNGSYVIKRSYTHAEMNPLQILSSTEALIPFGNMNPGVRITYECKQNTQALGLISSVQRDVYDTTMKSLAYPRRGLLETQLTELMGLSQLPVGDTLELAVMDFDSWNQEDSFVLNQALLDAGYLSYFVEKTFTTELISDHTKEGTYEEFRRPKLKPGERKNKFGILTARGLPQIHKIIRPKMAIIGKVRLRKIPGTQTEDPNFYEDTSVLAGPNDLGYIDSVIVVNEGQRNMSVTVKIRAYRVLEPGDKVSASPGQKGTISATFREADMPFDPATRKYIDIVMNPLAFTTRMTMGLLLEPIASTFAAILGKRLDASTFKHYDKDEFEKLMMSAGFNPKGKRKLILPATGRTVECSIFSGPVYIKLLSHNVIDKMRVRVEGKIDPITRQPVGGSKKDGGVKSGEMERDCYIAYGAGFLLHERFYYSSDRDRVPFCIVCGTISIVNIRAKTADGEIGEIKCPTCNNKKFGEVKIPHGYRVFLNILAKANINYFHRIVPKKREDRVETLAERRQRGED